MKIVPLSREARATAATPSGCRVASSAKGATAWTEVDLEQAMDAIARRVKATRDASFRHTATVDGREVVVNNTLAIASLGGATLDNEWNYAQAKLWRGLGGVFIENQARI